MGLLNKLWSKADFWDKKENAQQAAQFKEDEERKRREAQAKVQAQQQARAQQQAAQKQAGSTAFTPQANPLVNLPRKPEAQPTNVRERVSKQIYQNIPQSVGTAEQIASLKQSQAVSAQKNQELEAFKQARMPKALEDAKRQTSWVDRQFTDRKWDKRAEAMAISGAAKDYQEKHGYNKDESVLSYGRSASAKIDEAGKNNASQWLAPVISTGRVGTGLVQGAGGLYDILTPGKGTNRLSQAATKKAEEQDKLAKDLGINTAYKVGNVAGEIASYFIPGTIAVKAASKLPRTTKLTAKIAEKLAGSIDNVDDANKARQFFAARIRQNLTVDEVMQELAITGRYMGQNTARGGDTSWQSIATDAAMGVGGGLLTPNRGLKQLFNSNNQADEAAGTALSAGAGAAEEVIPALPKAPNPNEVADGVIKSPTAPTTPDVPPIQTPPVVTPPTTQVVPPTTAVTPPAPVSTPVPGAPGAPVLAAPGQSTPIVAPPRTAVPQAPQTMNPEIQKQVDLNTEKIAQDAVAPAPEIAPIQAAPVETTITKASKEAPPPVGPVNTTKVLSPEEMRATGDFTEEQIEAVMARRANPEATKAPEPKPDPKAVRAEAAAQADAAPSKADDLAELRARHEDAETSYEERGLLARLIRAEEQGDATPVKAARLEKARADLSAFEVEPPTPAKPKAPKTVETEKVDVAQSETTPVKPEKPFKPEPKTVDDQRALDKEVDDIKAQGKAMGVSDKVIQEQIDKVTALAEAPKKPAVQLGDPEQVKTPAQVKADNKKQAVDDAIMGRTELSKPKTPTQKQLDKGAVDNTVKSGKVSEAWKKKQTAAGATDEQIAKAVEKVEGRKVEPTADEKAKAADHKKTNEEYKQRKAEAAAEGRDKEAAPKLVKEMAKQKAKEMEESVSYFTKHFGSQVKSFNIQEELGKAYKTLDEKDETNIGQFVKDYLTKAETSDDPIDLFTGMALVRRLEELRRGGKLTDDGLLGLADEVYQSQASKVSKSGQVQRIAQEIYKNIPAKTRVEKKLDTLKTKLGEHKLEFEPTDVQKNELIKLTDEFDTSSTILTGMDGELATNLDDYAAATTKRERAKLFKKHQQLADTYKQSQKDTVANSLAFNDALKAMMPEMPTKIKAKDMLMRSPDSFGNYLRMAMLSAPSGRVRDALSTGLNLVDDLPVVMARALGGKIFNATTKSNLVDSVGSWQSLKKGIEGGASKVKSSWKGEYTLDEATGKIGTNDRSELLKKKGKNGKDPIESFGVKHSPRGSKWNLPKKVIRTLVQAPTDASYFKYTEELQNLGRVEARSRGITGRKEIDQFARMFADSPTKEAQQKAGQAWLANSGMQDNQISKGLTWVADKLDTMGTATKTVDGKKVKRSAAEQFAIKATARVFRTTTMPFVQYTGGATHAMFMRQNPANNAYQVGKAIWKKDPQAVIDNLARGGWNTTKIGALAYALDKGWVETSDTDADGKTSYNGPYLVKDGQYIPASTLGIAGGAAVIGGHYIHKFFGNVADGNFTEAITNISTEPALATLKATGMNNMLSGQNVFGGVFANADRVANDPNKTGADTASTLAAGLLTDIGSQVVPAASRDLNSGFDNGWTVGGKTIIKDTWNPTKEKPDTSGKDPITGKVNPWSKAKAQITAGIPGLSQQLPRKSGELARDFPGRVLNANTQSDQQKAEISTKKTEEKTSTDRTVTVLKNDKLKGLLSEEAKAIYDKYKGDMSKAQKADNDTVWKEISAAKNRLLDDGEFKSYSQILTYERDEAKSKGSSTATEIAKMDRNITRSDLAAKHNTNPQIYRLYTGTDGAEGGALSNDEFKRMIDQDDPAYDLQTATALWELDKLFTASSVSANTNGMNPWEKQKYSRPEDKSGKGGSGKQKTIATDFGTLGSSLRPSSGGQAQKYKKLSNPGGSMPSIAAAKTNLKKNISVVKGVRL